MDRGVDLFGVDFDERSLLGHLSIKVLPVTTNSCAAAHKHDLESILDGVFLDAHDMASLLEVTHGLVDAFVEFCDGLEWLHGRIEDFIEIINLCFLNLQVNFAFSASFRSA